jgi:hypothetical protein
MPVDTAKVEGRRQLDYQSYEELLADADRLSARPVKSLGNWSAGQVYRHVGSVIIGSIDGLPLAFPWYLRLAARLFKDKILSAPMPAGYKLPPGASEALVPPPISTEEGLAELHSAVRRVVREQRRARHPLFGDITREEWDRLQLKHASLHMSFLVPA